jgi:hypothetical protein
MDAKPMSIKRAGGRSGGWARKAVELTSVGDPISADDDIFNARFGSSATSRERIDSELHGDDSRCGRASVADVYRETVRSR